MRSAIDRLLLALLLTTPGAASPGAQPPQGGSPATFHSRTDLVVVHVTVVDKKAGFVSGLDRGDFMVYEDGLPQPVRFFLSEDTPVTVGLVLDNSASMRTRRDEVIAASMAFARASHPKDQMFTVNFNERVWPGLSPPRQFTSSLTAVHEALLGTTARGQTALFDAVLFGLAHLERGTASKKALVVLSDGVDNASVATVKQVLDAAHRTDAVIYAIGLFGEDRSEGNPRLLKALASATGGESLSPRKPTEIVPTLERVARNIRSSYTLGYNPTETAGKGRFRPIRVTVRTPRLNRITVRARAGYIAGAKDVVNVR